MAHSSEACDGDSRRPSDLDMDLEARRDRHERDFEARLAVGYGSLDPNIARQMGNHLYPDAREASRLHRVIA